jgi:YaiO family outer membrane protein
MRRILAALTASWLAAAGLPAQTPRVAAWGSYEGVTGSADWSTAGAQLTLATTPGHAVWAAAEFLSRFSAHDATQRIGGVLHPAPRWWITVEAGTALQPAFMPKNTWEADVTALLTRRGSFGLAYRRWNYVVGPVDVVIPHFSLQTRTVSWDVRVSLSRNPSQRTDAAFYVRATTPLTPRVAGWVLGGAGRESYVVGTAPTSQVRALDTATGAAGLRCSVGSGFTLRLDVSVIHSRPVLSRRGAGIGLERQF